MGNKNSEELIDREEPAITLIHDWIGAAENQCDVFPPSNEYAEELLEIQVTTLSTLGAFAYETGGVMVDHGLIAFPRLRSSEVKAYAF
ncbi:DUF2625 family protein [Pirellulaceae bacterium SH449]